MPKKIRWNWENMRKVVVISITIILCSVFFCLATNHIKREHEINASLIKGEAKEESFKGDICKVTMADETVIFRGCYLVKIEK